MIPYQFKILILANGTNLSIWAVNGYLMNTLPLHLLEIIT